MFKSLKEKLKGWVLKNEEVEEIGNGSRNLEREEKKKLKEEEKEKKRLEKERVRKEKEKKKEERKKKREEKKSKVGDIEDDLEEVVERTKELIDEVEEDVEDVAEEIDEEIRDKNPNLETSEEIGVEEKDIKKRKKLFSGKELTEEKFEEMFEELEMILLQNNVSYSAVDSIKESMNKNLVGKKIKEVDLSAELKSAIEELLINPEDFVETIKEKIKEESPYSILFSGINGAGKTTTIAKVANLLKAEGLLVCLVAADTFRAAAIQQLEEHAKKLDVPIVKKDYGADPASVGFDGIKYAKKNKIDVVLIDTAGRLQNRDTLMKEIEKISRVTKPDMKIFLGESITGNDATEQAKVFNETIGIDGIILSKAEIDEKGGTAISVSAVTGKPILFLGTGQGYDDLEVFDKAKIIEQLGL